MIKREGMVHLSGRLQALADMVSEGKTIVDVGCDHGFLDIYLVQAGKTLHALAMDVRKGPLSAAKEHVRECGLEDRIKTRLSDGLERFHAGEAQVLICAGMGGPLMQRILTDDPKKTASFEEMILQPQSEIREFRVFLRENGYRIVEERILLDEGKYYFPMKVCPAGNDLEEKAKGEISEDYALREIYDRYGKALIQRKDALLKEFLEAQQRIYLNIFEQLKRSKETDGTGEGEASDRRNQRLEEVKKELLLLDKAFEHMK